MRFRAKILTTILIAGLLPATAILVSAVYLLDSTLEKVGALGFESSLEIATGLLDETEAKFGTMMAEKLDSDVPWDNYSAMKRWLRDNQLNVAYRFGDGIPQVFTSDVTPGFPLVPELQNMLGTGINRVGAGGNDFIVYTKTESGISYGCGISMSEGYNSRGRGLALAVSAAAGLKDYKELSLQMLVLVSVFGFAFVMIASLIISSIFSKRLVKPLNILTNGAGQIGSGDLDHIVEIRGNDEFSQLADSFNKMTAEIKENQIKLIEAEKMAAWREVARRIAHEIKNPLTPIAIELFRLKQQAAGNEKIITQIDTVENQIKTLTDLAGHFSTFAKEPELKLVKCSLVKIISESVELYSNHDNVKINFKILEEIPELSLDSSMMSRVFNNLLKNSIECGEINTVIDINLTEDNNIVKAVVRDNGPGYPEDKLENIDRPYYTTKKSGTGLGMAVVSKIIREHGGEVRFYNDCGAVTEIKLSI